jgi:hypothetical protein
MGRYCCKSRRGAARAQRSDRSQQIFESTLHIDGASRSNVASSDTQNRFATISARTGNAYGTAEAATLEFERDSRLQIELRFQPNSPTAITASVRLDTLNAFRMAVT